MQAASAIPEEVGVVEASGVPGAGTEVSVEEGTKVPSPASVHEEDHGAGRKRETSPETERGDFKRLCATLETQLPSVIEKLQEQKLSNHLAEAVHRFVGVCQWQQFWIFMSFDVSSCDVHFTVLDLMSTVFTCH